MVKKQISFFQMVNKYRVSQKKKFILFSDYMSKILKEEMTNKSIDGNF